MIITKINDNQFILNIINYTHYVVFYKYKIYISYFINSLDTNVDESIIILMLHQIIFYSNNTVI